MSVAVAGMMQGGKSPAIEGRRWSGSRHDLPAGPAEIAGAIAGSDAHHGGGHGRFPRHRAIRHDDRAPSTTIQGGDPGLRGIVARGLGLR